MKTPAYVYDLPALSRRVWQLQKALTGIPYELCFATMANDQPEVLRTLARDGLGACVNSINHLKLARSADVGFKRKKIQFTASGISKDNMEMLIDLDIATNLDSLSQIKTWFEAGGDHCGVRINVDDNRIGINPNDLSAALFMAKDYGGKINGLHMYMGTNFANFSDMHAKLISFFDLISTVPNLEYINIGGGLGVDYAHTGVEFDINRYGEVLSSFMKAVKVPKLIIEPGRWITATCGTYYTTVTDIKELNGTRYVVVDGSTSNFPRPLQHPESPHHIRVQELPQRDNITSVVVGGTTYSLDILGTADLPIHLRIGEMLVIDDAGSYCQSMISNFLGQPEPETIYVE